MCPRRARANRPALGRTTQAQLIRAVSLAGDDCDDDDDDGDEHEHEEQESEEEPCDAPLASARSPQASLLGPGSVSAPFRGWAGDGSPANTCAPAWPPAAIGVTLWRGKGNGDS
jgi:hypothetical protein